MQNWKIVKNNKISMRATTYEEGELTQGFVVFFQAIHFHEDNFRNYSFKK